MALEIVTVPCLSDNYAYLAHDPGTGATAVVDVPEAAPITAVLAERGWQASLVILTHHHDDHVQGLPELLADHAAKVAGNAADAHRLPPLDIALRDGGTVDIGGETGHVIDVSGHTIGHIALHFPQSAVAFTADSLMALGCGRVFEGTMDQMWQSLSKLAALPPETTICSGHEYTAANARFALSIDPANSALISRAERIATARSANQPTVPSTLSDELATNPFLRASDPALKSALDMGDASDAEVFAEIRHRKDRF
ncbi:hydroxyacylglutathione hydrolase [Roseovarius sp.]|uniref:hydroxyacylglutathione hydrolase n=1 Tax=Roseovarius sp. TaxID=1486281 RepID=UPI000C5A9C3F|nr:hydroxyacylglutathione hydrolase [Roseovarius sp.]MAO27878.1 hydroxyacylglutathione hydrolase [Roseovarius sp.]MAZ21541.1 hydroxyacylglutathione hydrolase [Roseovarius sp.]